MQMGLNLCFIGILNIFSKMKIIRFYEDFERVRLVSYRLHNMIKSQIT